MKKMKAKGEWIFGLAVKVPLATPAFHSRVLRFGSKYLDFNLNYASNYGFMFMSTLADSR